MCDHLQQLFDAGQKTLLKEHEQTYGIIFDEEAMIFDNYTSRIANVPDPIYNDNMHKLLATGGVAQYECNQFVRTILKQEELKNPSLEDLDEWKTHINIPTEGFTRLF